MFFKLFVVVINEALSGSCVLLLKRTESPITGHRLLLVLVYAFGVSVSNVSTFNRAKNKSKVVIVNLKNG